MDTSFEYRQGFLTFHDDLWKQIDARNDVEAGRDGLFRRDIPAFNEDAVREVILNAVCHRDYRLGVYPPVSDSSGNHQSRRFSPWHYAWQYLETTVASISTSRRSMWSVRSRLNPSQFDLFRRIIDLLSTYSELKIDVIADLFPSQCDLIAGESILGSA